MVRAVKERRVRYIITHRGPPAAVLAPLDALSSQPDTDEVWARLEAPVQEIARNWQSDKSAAVTPLHW